jgi:hypothetical protein
MNSPPLRTNTPAHRGSEAVLRINAKQAGHVHFGSLADIVRRSVHVRFTPESGLKSDIAECLLCAKRWGNRPAVCG